MKITILGQGFNLNSDGSDDSVGKYLIESFSKKDFNSFIGISAFASQGGIKILAKHIEEAKEHLKNITIIVGIDYRGTTKEALEELIKLGVNSYIFYFPPKTPIFHPKIYLFEGIEKSELIIGSSNLTELGLFTNVETSFLVNVDNTIEDDRKIIEQLKAYFKGLVDLDDPNLNKISNELIAELVRLKLVPTENERKATEAKIEKAEREIFEKAISKIFPKRVLSRIPKEFRRSRPKAKEKSIDINFDEPVNISSPLLWDSGKLKERDLTIPKGANTNPTGSMLFKKGELEGIDQRHYFRDEVFSSLSWNFDTNPRTAHYERATAFFKLIIMEIDYGVFELTLSHNTKTDTTSYKDKNSMTSVSWGKARKHIAKEELIGKSAKLYKNGDKKDEFILIIE